MDKRRNEEKYRKPVLIAGVSSVPLFFLGLFGGVWALVHIARKGGSYGKGR